MTTRPATTDLPQPLCKYGYTTQQLKDILGPRYEEFQKWMTYQTGAICEGREWNPVDKIYVQSCDGVSHGMVVYPWDLKRFLNGLPIID